ncbi:MAG TPA: M20/M25/M40 family metallo-hydrolase, partial [Kofleriaceae bacterium]|nr:M20/M25/M40 family metallo-hydrolase [Kofleriaceae bacterium]
TGGAAGEHDTNVFVADWDGGAKGEILAETAAADRFIADVGYLADDAQEGRGVGTKGLERSLDYVQKAFEAAGAEPGNGGKWRQAFEVTVSVEREAATAMTLDGAKLEATDFAPFAYSASSAKTGKVSGAVVSVGSGIVDPDAKIDDYKGKDVRGKVVVLHEVLPPDVSADVTRKWSGLRRRVFVARGKGAAAVIAVDDGDLKRDEAKLPMLEPSHGDAGIPVVAVTRKAMEKGPKRADLVIALKPVKATTENVVGVIRAGAATKQPGIVVVGAHVDLLGMGGPFALDTAVGIHNGADDNASGTAGLLEVARTLAAKKAELPRDVYLVSFSAEEMGVLGSAHYVKNLPTKDPIVAMINMDMIGRMQRNHLSINGGESAKEWKELVAPVCDAARVDCSISGSGYGPSDHMSFYIAGIPVLFLFTGNHRDYHTMTDDTDKINAIGGARAAMIAAETAFAVAKRPGMLTYVKSTPDAMPDCKDPKDTACQQDDRPRNASLGTIPSYEERDKSAPPGLIISGVSPGGPAEKAGLKGGDRIVEIGGTAIDNINDLMFVLQAAKPGQPTTITYVRDGKRATVEATYGLPRRR